MKQNGYIESMNNLHMSYIFEKNIMESIERHQMIRPGEKVLCALSGGADSVCLFRVLSVLQNKLSFVMEAVHVNHMLRETADRDEQFVRLLCQEFSVPLHVRRADVKGRAQAERIGLEEAARQMRYALFEETMRETGAVRLAVAHHRDDQAETILFHLCRGCGLEGLRGMEPVREYIIRPMLGQDRAGIEAYLQAVGQSYVTDETNLQSVYSRNILRNEILPMLSANICENASAHIAQAGETAAQLEDFVRGAVQQAYDSCAGAGAAPGQAQTINISALQGLHPYLQSEVIRLGLHRLCGSKKDITRVHIADILMLAHKQTGSRICLPYHMQARRSYDSLIMEPEPDKAAQTVHQSTCLLLEGVEKEGFCAAHPLPDGRKLSLQIFRRPKDTDIPIKTCTKWFDYDKIVSPLLLRTPQADDYFMLDAGHKKRLKDHMKDEKIPAPERAKRPVLAMGSHILYVIGGRITASAKVTEQTDMILEVSIQS